MYSNKRYIMAILLCVVLLAFLIFENYRVGKLLNQKQTENNKIKVIEENKGISKKKFGYSDIIKAFENQEGVKITKFNQEKENNIASVELDIVGDISLVEKVLKSIQKRGNFQGVKNMKIEKREDNSIITRLNVNFINNN